MQHRSGDLRRPTTARSGPRTVTTGPGTGVAAGVVAVGLAGVVALGLATAVALPLLLDRHGQAAGTFLRGELQAVVDAQRAYATEHGGYTTRLADLHLQSLEGEVAVVRAGEVSYCVGAHDHGSGTTLFYSPGVGFSRRSCS